MRADLTEGCILKFRERHQRRPRQRLPLLFSSAARQTETLPSKYLFDARLERDATVHFMWSAGAAGEPEPEPSHVSHDGQTKYIPAA